MTDEIIERYAKTRPDHPTKLGHQSAATAAAADELGAAPAAATALAAASSAAPAMTPDADDPEHNCERGGSAEGPVMRQRRPPLRLTCLPCQHWCARTPFDKNK